MNKVTKRIADAIATSVRVGNTVHVKATIADFREFEMKTSILCTDLDVLNNRRNEHTFVAGAVAPNHADPDYYQNWSLLLT